MAGFHEVEKFDLGDLTEFEYGELTTTLALADGGCRSTNGYSCCRPPGHTGPHIATVGYSGDGDFVALWYEWKPVPKFTSVEEADAWLTAKSYLD
jgi:hypothetical protein